MQRFGGALNLNVHAIVFDLAAAFLAFFVLRRMNLPSTTVVRHEIAPSAGVVPAMKG